MTHTTSIFEQDAWQMLDQGATLVTVNQRLARYLRSEYNNRQIQTGREVWDTPEIIPFSKWLETIYNKGFYASVINYGKKPPALLSYFQELWVWEEIIYESPYGKDLLQIREAAKSAMQAWEICISWRLPLKDISQAASDDTAAFLLWADQFQLKCRENNWLDNEQLADFAADLFKSDRVRSPGILILAGFDELTPQQQSVIAAASASGATVYVLTPPSCNRTRARMAFADSESEMTAAAKWAKNRLENNPGTRIGVVVPDLASAREKLIRIFDDVFHPAATASAKNPGKRIYNVSLGQPLSEYPVIRDAIRILDIAFTENPGVDEYSQWLTSPFFAGAETEFTARAVLDASIRKIGETDIPVRQFLETAQKIASRPEGGIGSIAIFLSRMNRLMEVSGQIPDRQKPSLWAKDFTRLLDAAGWPGERTLDSDEYQTVSACRESLHRIAEMDAILREMDSASACLNFKRLLDDTIFQPETADKPVQILGMLESAGEEFDHLWIMGLDAETWPRPARPIPLVPVWAQRRHNVPHASSEREYGFARRITQRLLASASEAVVSHPILSGDMELYPSPLIAEILDQPHEDALAGPLNEYYSQIRSSVEFEKVEDRKGPPIEENSHVSGGTGLLKAQAACPFSAYARYRLGAASLETPVLGLSAVQRGGLIHHVLQYVWEILHSQNDLISKDETELSAAVDEAVGRAMDIQAQKLPGTFTKQFAALERQRLKNLVLQWLEQDKQRSPFTVVQKEEKTSCKIGGIMLNIVADRIDKTEDGRVVIVDYKTGDISEKNWFTPRVADPQLPLYSLIVKESVAAVLFAQVKKGSLKYLGIADDETIAPGVNGLASAMRYLPECRSMKEVIEFWREKLNALAIEFKEGEASVSPVSIHASCRYCDFGLLCRIREAVINNLLKWDSSIS